MTFSSLEPQDESHIIAGFESSRMLQSKFAKWVKYLLIASLLVDLVCGVAILSIGIWTHESEYGSKQLSTLIDVPLYEVDSFLLVGLGVGILLITFMGLCGVCTQYKCLMGLHLGLLSFLAVSLFVAGILGYVLIGELEDKVKARLEDTVTHNYGVNLPGNSKNDDITKSWDRIQQTFRCCGPYGNINSTKSWAIYKESSEWYTKDLSNGSYVPASCCDPASRKHIMECTGVIDVPNAPPRHGPPVYVDMMALNYSLYTDGCFDKLDGYLRGTGIIIGTVAIVSGVFLLLELVLSICMYRLLR